MLAAIDGHETHASYKRRHEGCLERKVTVGGRERPQYYHRFTVFQIIGKGFYFPRDAEPVVSGDDEVASALRLVARVLANHPRCFDMTPVHRWRVWELDLWRFFQWEFSRCCLGVLGAVGFFPALLGVFPVLIGLLMADFRSICAKALTFWHLPR
jgi:hypothetical protein